MNGELTNQQIFRQLCGSDRLALVVETAKHTQDAAYFDGVIGWLERYIDRHGGPVHSTRRVKQFLRKEKGTPLEPFVLSKRNIELATRFIQMAFCSEYPPGSVRIASEDSLVPDGGLLVNGSVEVTYLERYRERSAEHKDDGVWYMAPDGHFQYEGIDRIRDPLTRAISRPDDVLGYVLELNAPDTLGLGWECADHYRIKNLEQALGRFTRLAEDIHGRKNLGLRARIDSLEPFTVVIYPGEPEALVRFTALMAAGERILVDPGSGTEELARIEVDLQLSNDGACELGYRARRHGVFFAGTMRAERELDFDLSDEEIDWVFSEFEELKRQMAEEKQSRENP